MLEHLPHWLGRALKDVRAGIDKIVLADPAIGGDFTSLSLTSMAFANDGRMPARYTADGDGVSPPLVWGDVPDATRSLALIVEDADSPSREPFVHAIVWNLAPDERALAEGAIVDDGAVATGRNSYFGEGWLAPDPPTGHGAHRYAFQLFALSDTLDLGDAPGRSALVEAIAGKVLAAGLLIGTYSRGEEAPVGPVGSAVRA